jgi:hypothetical protein
MGEEISISLKEGSSYDGGGSSGFSSLWMHFRANSMRVAMIMNCKRVKARIGVRITRQSHSNYTTA